MNVEDLYVIKNGDTGEKVASGLQGNFEKIVTNLNLKIGWTSTSTAEYPDKKSILFSAGDSLALSHSGGVKDVLYTDKDDNFVVGEESLTLKMRTKDAAIGVQIFGSDTVRYLAYKDEISSTSLVGTLSIPSYFQEDGYDVVYYPSMTEDIFNSLLNIVSIDGQVYPYPGLTFEEGKAYLAIVKRGDLSNPHKTMLVSRDSDSIGFFGKLIFSLYDSIDQRLMALEDGGAQSGT